MNTIRTRTRRGAAILFSGILVLGGLTLAGEADAAEEVPGNPTCPVGYEYTEKVEDPSGDYTFNRSGMTATITVGTFTDQTDPNPNNAIISRSIPTTDYVIIVKGGAGAILYGPGDSPPLHAPAVSSDKWPTISHFDLCWNKPAPQPEVGQIQVTKTVVGDPPADASYVITITGPDSATTTQSKTVVPGQTVTFGNLLPGTYTVTETPGTGYTVNITPGTVQVTAGGLATVAVVNTYSKEESLPPTTPTTPTTPATPVAPVAPAAPAVSADVAAQATLPATGSNGAIAALAMILLATGVTLTLLSRRRGPQQA
jgi:LPXTG-motif cell wall-anchored protein